MTWLPNPYAQGELVVVVDCADLGRAARFWAGVLGYEDAGRDSETYRSVLPADGFGVAEGVAPPSAPPGGPVGVRRRLVR